MPTKETLAEQAYLNKQFATQDPMLPNYGRSFQRVGTDQDRRGKDAYRAPVQQVSITLEKPFVRELDGKMRLIIIGEEPPETPNLEGKMADIRQIPGVPQELIHTQAKVTQVRYEFDATDDEKNTFVVNDYVAKHWFGDWTYPESQTNPQASQLATKGNEGFRVAQIWGGFKYHVQSKMTVGTANAFAQTDMRPIAPPDVPHVAIRVLTKQGKPATVDGKEWVFRPWDYFNWRGMCNPEALHEIEDAKAPVDLDRIVAEKVAAILAQRLSPEPSLVRTDARERMAKARAAKAAKKAAKV